MNHSSMPKPKRRPEDGRPPLHGEPTQMVTARVPVSGVRTLRRVGDGNLSQGVCRLILLYYKLPEAVREELLSGDGHPGRQPAESDEEDEW